MDNDKTQSSPPEYGAATGSALIDALAVVCRHIEELERIYAETKAIVMTCEAKALAAKLVDEIISQNTALSGVAHDA